MNRETFFFCSADNKKGLATMLGYKNKWAPTEAGGKLLKRLLIARYLLDCVEDIYDECGPLCPCFNLNPNPMY